MSGNLGSLAAALAGAVHSIEAAQSSCSITIGRGGDALQRLAAVTDGSRNDNIAQAYGALAFAADNIEQAIANYVLAKDKVLAFAAERGLG